MAMAEYTAVARVRGGPSGKVTAISDSAVGAAIAAPAPCTARGGDQPGLAGGEPAEQRRQDEDQQPGEEDPAAFEQVAGPAAEQQQPAERHGVGVDHPRQVRPGKAERGLDVRQGDGALFGLVVCPAFPQAGMSGRECHGAVADDRGMAADDDLGDPAVLFVRRALQGAGAPHGYALVDLNTVGAVPFR